MFGITHKSLLCDNLVSQIYSKHIMKHRKTNFTLQSRTGFILYPNQNIFVNKHIRLINYLFDQKDN